MLKVLKIPYKTKQVYANNVLINDVTTFAIDETLRSIVIKDKQ